MESTMNDVQDKILRWFASEAATQGKTIRIENEVLPDHDVEAILTPRRDFDMAMLKSGDQDIAGWAREATHALVAELPEIVTVTPQKLQLTKMAYMITAWIALYVMTPNKEVSRE